MSDEQKIDELTKLRKSWTGDTPEGFYMPMSLQVLTSLYNQEYLTDLLNGDKVISLIGYFDDYKL